MVTNPWVGLLQKWGSRPLPIETTAWGTRRQQQCLYVHAFAFPESKKDCKHQMLVSMTQWSWICCDLSLSDVWWPVAMSGSWNANQLAMMAAPMLYDSNVGSTDAFWFQWWQHPMPCNPCPSSLNCSIAMHCIPFSSNMMPGRPLGMHPAGIFQTHKAFQSRHPAFQPFHDFSMTKSQEEGLLHYVQ